MVPEKIQITVKLPVELHDQLTTAIKDNKYHNMTIAVVAALEKLLSEDTEMSSEVQKLTIELQKNAVTFDYMKQLNDEKDRHIETLKNELIKSEHDKEDLKNTYSNYFLQVQTLINKPVNALTGNKITKEIKALPATKPWWKLW